MAACAGSGGTALQADTASADSLPAPYATKSSVTFAHVTGWPEGKTPVAPEGFTVSLFAGALNSPRWIYVTPDGDILVAEARTQRKGIKKAVSKITGQASSQNRNDRESANRIILFRDADHDGMPELTSIFLEDLNQPFGMLVLDSFFYVANTDGLWRYPYRKGDTRIVSQGTKILELPAGGYNNHWTRNIIADASGSRIYVSVGSGSNVGENGMEHERRRANILVVKPDGSGEQVYASGLRNPVGMDWAPGTTTLWTAVNERDELGDELVPDYITGVKPGGFYGWPYSYWGKHPDPRLEGTGSELVARAIVPDVNLGAHTASLGLAFSKGHVFPAPYAGGAFVGQHGSWNRSSLTGYKVVYVPFQNGRPSSPPVDFLTGFMVKPGSEDVYGRPVGIAFTPYYMLVADDAANMIWCVRSNSRR